jgi:hypothetical protein
MVGGDIEDKKVDRGGVWRGERKKERKKELLYYTNCKVSK